MAKAADYTALPEIPVYNRFDTAVVLEDAAYSDTLGTGFLSFGGSTLTGPRICFGSADPSAGAGTVAPIGSLYLRTNGQLWSKTGAGAAAWTMNGTLAGAVVLTGIDSTATADFDWDLDGNSPTAFSFDAAGAAGIFGIDSTNAAENAFWTYGLRGLDASTLQFGTPGTDIVLTADGTDVLVTGTGRFNFEDDVVCGFGNANDARILWANGAAVFWLRTVDYSDAAGTQSGALTAVTGDVEVTGAAVGNPSGAMTLITGATNSTNAGGTAGASGAWTGGSGASNSTLGTSGATGAVNLRSGDSVDATSGALNLFTGTGGVNTGGVTIRTGNATTDSGSLTLQIGTAGGTRGSLILNAATVDCATQGQDWLIIDNTANAYRVLQGANAYLHIRTSNDTEAMTVGNYTTNPSVDFSTNRAIVTDGVDHGTRLVLNAEFRQRPQLVGSIANTNACKEWEVAGTNSTDAGCVFWTGGGISLTTGAVLGDQEIVWPNTAGGDTTQSPWKGLILNFARRPKLKATVRAMDVINTRLAVGWKQSITLDNANDDDQCWLGMDSAGTLGGVAGDWVLVVSIAGVDTQVVTGVTVTATTNYRIVLDVQTDRTCRAYVNGLLVATSGALTAAPANPVWPVFGVQALAGAGRQFVVQRATESVNYG